MNDDPKNCGQKSCDMKCPLTGCKVTHILITTAVVFAITFLFDWLFHGVLLKDAYMATASLWRPEEEYKAMWGVCLLYHGVLAFGVASLFCFVSKNSPCCGKCPVMGMKFGFLLGLVLGISHFSAYIWTPMPLDLAVHWLLGAIVWGVMVGYTLSFVKGKFCCDKGTCGG